MVSPHAYTYYRDADVNPLLPGVVLCGPGDRYQLNPQRTANPTFELLHPPPGAVPLKKAGRGKRKLVPATELATLAAKVNEVFQAEAQAVLAKVRAQPGWEAVEVTVLLAPEGLRMAFNLPSPKQERAAPMPRRVVAPRVAHGVSRLWFKVFKG